MLELTVKAIWSPAPFSRQTIQMGSYFGTRAERWAVDLNGWRDYDRLRVTWKSARYARILNFEAGDMAQALTTFLKPLGIQAA